MARKPRLDFVKLHATEENYVEATTNSDEMIFPRSTRVDLASRSPLVSRLALSASRRSVLFGST